MAAIQTLVAANSLTAAQKVPQNKAQAAVVATSADTPAGAEIAIMAEVITGELIQLTLFNGVEGSSVDSITGPSQYAWTNIPGAQRVYAKRLDANGGNAHVALDVVEA